MVFDWACLMTNSKEQNIVIIWAEESEFHHKLDAMMHMMHMMPWPLHCKIREEPIHQKRNFTRYTFKYTLKYTSQSMPLEDVIPTYQRVEVAHRR